MTNLNRQLRMPLPVAVPQKRKRLALPGYDGKTLGARLREAMAYKSGRLGYEYRQTDLLEDMSRIAGRTSTDKPLLSQQMLSSILNGQISKTSTIPFLAAACGVNALWLGEGVGKMLDR